MDRNHPRTSHTPAAPALLLVALAAGCHSYEPAPLDPAAHRAAWLGRELDGATLAAFVERLDARVDVEGFDAADGLSLPEGQLVALVHSPALRLARLRVARAAAGAAQAGRWADPRFDLELLHVTDDVPEPWVITPSLAFTLPLSGSPGAARDLAEAERRASEGALREAEWGVWRDVRAVWIAWSAARLRAAETEALVERMQSLVSTATALAEQGEVPRAEASLLLVERSGLQNRLRRLVGEAAALEAELRVLLGLAPSASVELVPTLAPPDDAAHALPGVDALAARNPALARLRLEHEVSERALRLEVRRQYPDLTLGPLFESDQGQSRVGLLGGVPIPFLNANRRAIAEASVARELARAEVETGFERLVGRWAAATARAGALAGQLDDLERVLVPLVDRQLEEALALMRLGEGASTLVLLQSLQRAYQTKLELIDTRADEAVARTEVAFLIGPEPAEDDHDSAEVRR
ncbi:MAG TPA: TolC family protein [Planctomycetota bacterium]|nr:TolC family protein [Planctomycetota bacterium]